MPIIRRRASGSLATLRIRSKLLRHQSRLCLYEMVANQFQNTIRVQEFRRQRDSGQFLTIGQLADKALHSSQNRYFTSFPLRVSLRSDKTHGTGTESRRLRTSPRAREMTTGFVIDTPLLLPAECQQDFVWSPQPHWQLVRISHTLNWFSGCIASHSEPFATGQLTGMCTWLKPM